MSKKQDQKSKLVYHTEVKNLPLDKLTKNNWNPNFVTSAMMEAIVDDIRKHGFIGTVVVQKHNKQLKADNVIINGEHRWEALKTLDAKQIPCTVLDIDDKTAKLLTLRLNREHGELMPDKVTDLLSELVKGQKFDNSNQSIQALRELTMMPVSELSLLTEMKFQPEELLNPTMQTKEMPELPLQKSSNIGASEEIESKDDSQTIVYDWYDVEQIITDLANDIKMKYEDPVGRFDAILAIPNGGLIPARLLARELGFYARKGPHYQQNIRTSVYDTNFKNILVVDDIYDTGKTYNTTNDKLSPTKFDYAVLVTRDSTVPNKVIYGKSLNGDKRWVKFPWEIGTESRRDDINSAF